MNLAGISVLIVLSCLFKTELGLSSSAVKPAIPIIETIRIEGTIDPANSAYLSSAIRQAEEKNIQVLIVELDTPGGLVSSAREMVQTIDQATVPVVVYVTPAGASATSAGALIILSSHFAAMAMGTNVGAAHPVGAQGEDIKGTMGEKALNDLAAFARGLAELRGRNRELAEAVVLKSKSLTASEAFQQHFIDAVVSNKEDLINQLDNRSFKLHTGEKVVHTQGAVIEVAKMTFGQSLLHYIANPNIAAILMTVGILLLYLELSNPGVVAPGVLGVIFLLVAFVAFQMLPIRIGALALIIVGVILLLAEPFVTSHGVVALGGLLSFFLGLLWIMDPFSTYLKISLAVLVPAVIILGGLIACIGYAAVRISRLSKATLAKIGGGSIAGLSGYQGHVETVGPSGKSGKGIFRGELWDIESDRILKVGDSIEVLSIEGMKLRVK